MVRCFEDPNVIHVAGKVDPLSDIEVINTELALADGHCRKSLARYIKPARAGDKEAQRPVAVLEKAQTVLDQAKAVRTLDRRARRVGRTAPVLPDHRQADHVCSQRA